MTKETLTFAETYQIISVTKIYNMWKLIISIIITITVISCSSPNTKIDASTYSEYQKKGDEITILTQAILLSNVGKAIQSGGTEYAVEFCNLKASSIVDSLNAVNNCAISRVSQKNRNPENNLKNETETTIIKLMSEGSMKDTLIRSENTLIYFKPIRTALAACLKCHGNPGSDINTATMQKINQLYPNDLATGYQLNEFRGMWKVKFTAP